MFGAARATGLLLMSLWAWQGGRHPRSVLALEWDGRWYYRIVEWGYHLPADSVPLPGFASEKLAFFPLYPGLIRVVDAVLPIGDLNAALFISWVSAGVAAWGIYAIGELLYGRRTGIALVLLWGLLPHAIVLTMAYAEPLMTAFAAWALYAVLTRRWLAAGTLAALAGLARPNGIAVAAAVSVAVTAIAWRRHRAHEPQDGHAWIGAALAPLGWLGYIAWVGVQTGDPLGYFAIESRWGSRFDFGQYAAHYIAGLVTGRNRLAVYAAVAIVGVSLLLLVLAVLDRVPLPLLVYTAVLTLIALGGTDYFQSKPRFLLPAFPLLIPLAIALSRARPRTACLAVAALASISFFYGTYLLLVSPLAP
ncbi:hypothetical protein [Streptomyces sp. WM6378]|uniref:hypothetical protein n=1 Tax=Streptomyces sp. WM6378 TaxID=1415557 RepID=UPI001F383CD2|nr:hypothetical protein [Streptomyces sp. WM6378]